jgi:hypothetical protein
MLGEPHAVEPERVGELDLGEALRVDRRLGAPRMRRYGKLVEEID